MSQLALFDMTFTFFHTITLLAFFSYIERPERPSRLILAAAASALACLTKGLIGLVLPGLIVIFFLVVERQTLRWRPFLLAWLPWLLVIFALLCVAIAAFGLHISRPFMRPYVVAIALIYLGFFLTALQEQRPHFERLLALSALGSLAGFVVLFLLFSAAHPNRYASKDLAMALLPHLTPHSYVFVASRYEDLSSFDFYLHRTIYVFDPDQGDLYYGIRHNPHVRRLITDQAFVNLIRRHHVFIAGPASQEASWARYGYFHTIASNGHDVVVENRRDLGRRANDLQLR